MLMGLPEQIFISSALKDNSVVVMDKRIAEIHKLLTTFYHSPQIARNVILRASVLGGPSSKLILNLLEKNYNNNLREYLLADKNLASVNEARSILNY